MKDFKEFIIEKLKVSTKAQDVVRIELRNFVTWYMYDDPDWDYSDLQSVEFARNTTESYFGGSYKKLYEFICKYEQDIIDVREYADTYGNYYVYEFTVEDIPFKVEAYIEKPSDLLSKQWRILVEKLKVSAPKVINCTVRQLFKKEFDRKFNYNDLVGFFTDVRKEHFDDNVYDMIDFLKEHANDKIEVTQETEDIIPDFGKVVKYTFTIAGIEFTDIIVVEYVNEKLKVSSNAKPDVIDCTVKQFMDWFWRDKDSKYTGLDLEIFQFGGDAIDQISPSKKDYDKMYVFLRWREDEDIEITEQIESGRSHKLNTDWQYGIYTFTLDGVLFDVTAPFSSDEDPFSVYYEKLMEIEL